mmetsp:Transcript_14885/g.35081  ORF Transcript_14885/g.35081 Transcript_14885/m.35081 type:complete len:282 (-) Transcript_14885:27-872(-)|eukprot:CAMPEP_0172583314 /NCGR_PEP_ID=MMETSP1068-20121228/2930_1 /TAXON_ID=35684 /ORGANISM="Pseudopedinella elastica, Strain CCMP716" /LENGTH=281 /DNA_ID=CAMNT_0013377057 /DNA_START=178 /DNA_END=1023 /DNA_ORIENTATION=-
MLRLSSLRRALPLVVIGFPDVSIGFQATRAPAAWVVNRPALQCRTVGRLASTEAGEGGLWGQEELEGMSARELKAAAQAAGLSTSDCFEKKDLVERCLGTPKGGAPKPQGSPAGNKPQASNSGGGLDNGSTGEAGAAVALKARLGALSSRELRGLIHRAGLSSKGLLEKSEFIDRAVEAQAVLDARPKFADAERYTALGVRFFGRRSCPYCIDALKVLEARGLGEGSQVMLDVEKDRDAAIEFQKLGGEGVPYFHSAQTGKSASGWRPGASTLDWVNDALQ